MIVRNWIMLGTDYSDEHFFASNDLKISSIELEPVFERQIEF